MLVIMDLEWDKKGARFFPTQLSALRVLSGWKVSDRFDSIIQPLKTPEWSFVAYNGYEPDQFLYAPTAASVLNRFSSWMLPDDVLCWWSSHSAAAFITFYKTLLKQAPECRMRLIAPSVFKKMDQYQRSHSISIYELGRLLNIDKNGTEHCSSDDVDLIRIILEKQKIQQSAILNDHIPASSYDHVIWDLDGKKSKLQKQPVEYNYAIDRSANLVHVRSCPRAGQRDQLIFVPSMKNCMKKQLRPCKCCKEEFWTVSVRSAEEIIQKCHFNFIFSGSGLFHKPSCMHVKHIPAVDIKGTVYYATAEKHGYKPCGWCRPKPTDEVKPPAVADQDRIPNSKEVRQIEGNSPDARKQRARAREKADLHSTRNLTRAELNAIRRHKQASQERASLPKDLSGIAGHDAHILTQSGYAFWSAKGYQTFHTRKCPKLARLSDLSGFATYADACRTGLTPCRICKPTAKDDITVSVPIYQRRRAAESIEDLDRLCGRMGWQHMFDGKEYIIETPVGKWKIIPHTSPLDVYHINKVKTPDNQDNYHRQHRLFLSMTDTMEYIKRHDRELTEKVAESIPDSLLTDTDLPEID